MRRIALLAALLLAGCGEEPGPPLVVSDIEITRPMPGMSMSAGYLTLRNGSGDAIRITRVTSPQFDNVEMHETRLEDGVSKMRRLSEVILAPGSNVIFERGGKHLMLMRPADDLSTITLNFYSDDLLLLTASTATED